MIALDDTNIYEVSAVLKSISHPSRLKILLLLACKGEQSVTDIQKAMKLTQSMTSQHLIGMKSRDILAAKKEDNRVLYSIKNKAALKMIACMSGCKKNATKKQE